MSYNVSNVERERRESGLHSNTQSTHTHDGGEGMRQHEGEEGGRAQWQGGTGREEGKQPLSLHAGDILMNNARYAFSFQRHFSSHVNCSRSHCDMVIISWRHHDHYVDLDEEYV